MKSSDEIGAILSVDLWGGELIGGHQLVIINPYRNIYYIRK